MSEIENFFEDPTKKKGKVDVFFSELSAKTEGVMRELLLGRPYRGLFKDLEITKGQFTTLYLLFLSFISLLLINIFLNIDYSQGLKLREIRSEQIPIAPGSFIILGILLGFIIGGYLLDHTRGKRYPLLFIILFVSIIISFLHIVFFRRFGDTVPKILFFINSFNAGVLFIYFLIFYIDFTTILERGRVFSYLIITIGVSLGFFIYLISYIEYLVILPLVFLCASFYYFYRNREKEEPYKPIDIEESKHRFFNIDAFKYIILLSFFGLTIGLFIPSTDVESLSNIDLSTIQIIAVTLFAIIFSLITATIVGMVFDFYGRKASISNIILLISIVNFIKLFKIDIQYFQLAIVFTAFLAYFMSVPLLISEVASRRNLGKILGFSFTITLFSVLIGFSFGYFIQVFFPEIFTSKYTAEIFLIGIINFAAIVSLFFLVNMKDTISSKEQNWPEYLLHLYVIHESGVLLFDYSFIEEELVEADLISGGFVGLVALLQEITREEQRLKSIDHGGKRILFGFNSDKSIIYALIVSEELLILRNKFFYFIQDIEDNYKITIEDFSGVDSELWANRIKPIMEKHFKRKYFELIPDLANIEENNNKKLSR
ncbi:MAG: MFS transporter [Promethearchaeota archaeon]